MTKEHELIARAYDTLSLQLGSDSVSVATDKKHPSDTIFNIGSVHFVIITKGTLQKSNLSFAIQQAEQTNHRTDLPILMVIGYAAPSIMQSLFEQGINVIDYAGNCLIKHGLLFVNISGQRNNFREEAKSHVLTENAIRLIFKFLTDDSYIARPYRTISEQANQSLGSIKNTIEELTNRQFVLHTDKGRKIINRDELIKLWVQAYNDILKPKLFLRRMKFRTLEMQQEWKTMKLPQGMVWGGDCGANIIDGYLIPGSYDIYTDKSSSLLMTTGKVLPDDSGIITIYQKFWEDADDAQVAPKLVIYADLIGSGDYRCLEAAERLLKDGI